MENKIKNNNTKTFFCDSAKGLAVKKMAVLLCCVLFAQSAFSQLVITKNTIVYLETAQSSITSQATNHNIQSSITGKGALILLGSATGKKQTLSIVDGATLPNLVLANASVVELTAPVSVVYDLTIKKGVLSLNHTLALAGDLHLMVGSEIAANSLDFLLVEQEKNYMTAAFAFTPFLCLLGNNPHHHNLKKPLVQQQPNANFYYLNPIYTIGHAEPSSPPPQFA